MDIPEHLAFELEEAEEWIAEGQARMNSVQHRIALWHCEQGTHVFGTYINPPIGRACVYCRAPAPEQDAAVAAGSA